MFGSQYMSNMIPQCRNKLHQSVLLFQIINKKINCEKNELFDKNNARDKKKLSNSFAKQTQLNNIVSFCASLLV